MWCNEKLILWSISVLSLLATRNRKPLGKFYVGWLTLSLWVLVWLIFFFFVTVHPLQLAFVILVIGSNSLGFASKLCRWSFGIQFSLTLSSFNISTIVSWFLVLYSTFMSGFWHVDLIRCIYSFTKMSMLVSHRFQKEPST